jgi:hypothetical protein
MSRRVLLMSVLLCPANQGATEASVDSEAKEKGMDLVSSMLRFVPDPRGSRR